MRLLPILLLIVLVGCEAEMPINASNVEGTWSGSYDFMPMTFTFNADDTFTYVNGPPTGGTPAEAWLFGKYADLPGAGTWRVTTADEPEVVWMVEGGMVDSAFVRSITATSMTLQFEGKPPVVFEKQ